MELIIRKFLNAEQNDFKHYALEWHIIFDPEEVALIKAHVDPKAIQDNMYEAFDGKWQWEGSLEPLESAFPGLSEEATGYIRDQELKHQVAMQEYVKQHPKCIFARRASKKAK